MARHSLSHFSPRYPRLTALAVVLATPSLWAQSLPPVTVAAKATPVLEVERAQVGGLNQTLAKTPQSIVAFWVRICWRLPRLKAFRRW